MKDKSRTYFIDGIKTILCCMVAFGHFYNFLGGRYVYGIRFIGGMGARAVDVFFFLSAFLATLAYHNKKKDPGEMLINRLKRLYPEYLPVILTAILTVTLRSSFQEKTLIYYTGSNTGAWGAVYSVQPVPDPRSIFLHLIFCNGIIPCSEILGVTWSLPIEVWFYFIFILVLFLFKGDENKTGRCFMVLYVISLIMGAFLYCDGFFDHQQNIIRSLPILFMGVIFAELYLGRVKRVTGWICTGAGLLYLLILDVGQNWLSAGIIMGVIILLIGDSGFFGSIRSFLSNGFFRNGCRLSYSVYLIHTIVISLVFGGLICLNEHAGIFSKTALGIAAFILSILFTVLFSEINNRIFGARKIISTHH